MADTDTVRLLADVTATDWPDANVQTLLDMHTGAIKLAAADLLEVLAGRLTDVKSDQIELAGSKQAKTLMDRAAALRTQHYELEGGDFYFDEAQVGSLPRYDDDTQDWVLGHADDGEVL